MVVVTLHSSRLAMKLFSPVLLFYLPVDSKEQFLLSDLATLQRGTLQHLQQTVSECHACMWLSLSIRSCIQWYYLAVAGKIHETWSIAFAMQTRKSTRIHFQFKRGHLPSRFLFTLSNPVPYDWSTTIHFLTLVSSSRIPGITWESLICK